MIYGPSGLLPSLSLAALDLEPKLSTEETLVTTNRTGGDKTEALSALLIRRPPVWPEPKLLPDG